MVEVFRRILPLTAIIPGGRSIGPKKNWTESLRHELTMTSKLVELKRMQAEDLFILPFLANLLKICYCDEGPEKCRLLKNLSFSFLLHAG